jgi:hypothetical protein
VAEEPHRHHAGADHPPRLGRRHLALGHAQYEAVDQLSRLGIGGGQPSCVGIGGDPVIGAERVGRLDVRAAIETHDGANIYVSYTGVLHMTENGAQAPQR